MSLIIQSLIVIIALLHVYFLVLEMFLWERPRGLRAFSQTAEQAAATKTLAANQGLYNGFLAAGLVWSVLAKTNSESIQLFFLACVLVAGIFGGLTASRKILIVQALPAALTLLLIALF